MIKPSEFVSSLSWKMAREDIAILRAGSGDLQGCPLSHGRGILHLGDGAWHA